MIVKISAGRAEGSVSAPPSKSMAHRLLMCAAFSEGSTVAGVDFSEDVLATLDCLRTLGARVETTGDTVTLGGLDIDSVPENTELFCRESGSTLRFFIPICLLTGKKIKLLGSARLMERPQSVYEDICREQGILFDRSGDGITLCGKLRPGEYSVAGDVSSQFITGLMFALARLPGDSVIKLVGKCESRSYIDLTVKALADFGVTVLQNENEYLIKGGQSFCSRNLSVEGDYSNAAFFDALNLLGSKVRVTGLDPHSLQGDRVYKDLFSKLGGSEEIDLSDCPDLAPVLFALSAFVGKTVFVGTKRLKIKESDRAAAMKDVLSRFGVQVDIAENEVTVWGGKITAPKEPLPSFCDHRIVMSAAVLLTLTGGSITGAEAVNKSFPDFFKKLSSLGINIEVCSL